jgi:hypothetical protein
MDSYVWRYFVRSKDRISGTPNNFVVQLPNPIPDNCNDVWIQVQTIYAGAYPQPADSASVASQNATSGFFNQPTLPAASLLPNNYGYDVGGAVDLCIASNQTVNTLDTESATPMTYVTSAVINGATAVTMTIPMANKTGICASGAAPGAAGDSVTIAGLTGTVTSFTATGVIVTFGAAQTWALLAIGTTVAVTPAQPAKSRSDKTLALIPYARGDNERTLRLWYNPPWVKLASTNLSQLNIKLFSDKGFPLKLRKFYAVGVADIPDINIDDWAFEILVTTKSPLPHGASSHKI